MSVTIELPHVGESVVEGTIGKWLKQPGDTVKRYEPLVEIITDKVTMEVPSPVEGSLVRLLAQEGETLPMGAPIAEVATVDSPEGADPVTASIEIETEPASPSTASAPP
ncbi:MAG: biotin/lipoyl-containing protein, partial [Dehalococcoidia bacterium]